MVKRAKKIPFVVTMNVGWVPSREDAGPALNYELNGAFTR